MVRFVDWKAHFGLMSISPRMICVYEMYVKSWYIVGTQLMFIVFVVKLLLNSLSVTLEESLPPLDLGFSNY